MQRHTAAATLTVACSTSPHANSPVHDPGFAPRLLARLFPFALSPASGPATRARPGTPIRFTPSRTDVVGPPPRPTRPPAQQKSLAARIARLGVWLLLALGWAVFASWWVIVLRRERLAALGYAGGVIAAIVVVSAVAMMLWTHHNIRIARNGKRGSSSRYIPMHWEHDTLGRRIELPAPSVAHAAAEVRVVLRDGVKSYVPVREVRS